MRISEQCACNARFEAADDGSFDDVGTGPDGETHVFRPQAVSRWIEWYARHQTSCKLIGQDPATLSINKDVLTPREDLGRMMVGPGIPGPRGSFRWGTAEPVEEGQV